jgi:hypothetical protein
VGDNICPELSTGALQTACSSGACHGFQTAPGWDPVTGLGTPNFAVMQALIAASLPGSGSVYSDPYFYGFWRQTFYVHGLTGHVYSLISDRSIQFNARLVFLSNITCPSVSTSGVHCSSHPGTYFGEMSLSSASGDRLHVVSGGVSDGFTLVSINGVALQVGESYGKPLAHHHRLHSAAVNVSDRSADHAGRQSIYALRTSDRQLTVHAGLFEMQIENSDWYTDIVTVNVTSWTKLFRERPEGLLGRTWNATVTIPPNEDTYREKDGKLWGCNVDIDNFCTHRQQS